MATHDPARLEAEALADVERAQGGNSCCCPDCGAEADINDLVEHDADCEQLDLDEGDEGFWRPAPLAPKSDRRGELKARVLNSLRLATERPVPGSLLDCDLAVTAGVLDRDVLRPLLCELAIDGKIVIDLSGEDDEEYRWVDRARTWLVRLAPAGTPSLEDRIVSALAEAGVEGLEEDTLCSIVIDVVADACGEEIADTLGADGGERIVSAAQALVERGVVRELGCGGHYTLSHAEWARRIEISVRDWLLPSAPRMLVCATIRDLLSGAEPERPAAEWEVVPGSTPATPAQPTRRTGEA